MSYNKQEIRNLFHRIGGAMLLFLALYTVLYGAASNLMQSFVSAFPRSAVIYIVFDLICSLSYVMAFTIPVAFFYWISKHAEVQPMGLSLRLSEKRPVFSTLTIVFVGISVCLSCSYINSVLFPVPDAAYDMLSSPELDEGYKLILMFISTAIVPAFVEELLFRGMILSNILPYNKSAAILISAVLFGLMHQTPFQFFYTTAVGVLFGIVYVKTGSIWSGVLLHFFNNFFSVLQSYLLEIFDATVGETVYHLTMCIVIGLGIVLGVVFYIINRKMRWTQSAEALGIYGKSNAVRKHKDRVDALSVFTASMSPSILIFAVLCVLTMVFIAFGIGVV